MPVLYKPFQSNLEDKKSGKKLFYPHVVRTGNINSAQLSKEIAAYSSLSPGDVKNRRQRQMCIRDRSSIVRKRQCGWFGNVPHGDECPWPGC